MEDQGGGGFSRSCSGGDREAASTPSIKSLPEAEAIVRPPCSRTASNQPVVAAAVMARDVRNATVGMTRAETHRTVIAGVTRRTPTTQLSRTRMRMQRTATGVSKVKRAGPSSRARSGRLTNCANSGPGPRLAPAVPQTASKAPRPSAVRLLQKLLAAQRAPAARVPDTMDILDALRA